MLALINFTIPLITSRSAKLTIRNNNHNTKKKPPVKLITSSKTNHRRRQRTAHSVIFDLSLKRVLRPRIFQPKYQTHIGKQAH